MMLGRGRKEMFSKLSVEGTERSNYIFAIRLDQIFILGFGQRQNLLFTSVLCRCKKVLFMIRTLSEMFYFLFAIKHLPTVNA